MKFWRREVSKKQCDIPYCGSEVYRTVRIGKNLLRLCGKHFRQCSASREAKKKIDNEWLTAQRKKRFFDAKPDEQNSLNNLVSVDVLEHHAWGGRHSYRPTVGFSDLVARMEVDIFLKGYSPSMCTLMEDGAKIALRKSLSGSSAEEIEKYTELVSPFILFDRMDRDLNPRSDRYKHGGESRERKAASDAARIKVMQPITTASLLFVEAMAAHEIIAATHKEVPTLSTLKTSENIKKEVETSWKYICDNIEHKPTIDAALAILANVPASPDVDFQLRSLANLASAYAQRIGKQQE